MHRFSFTACLICLALCPAQIRSEEQVTLKSGTRLIGSVTLDGQTVNVSIGDSKLAIPLSEVDLIGPAGTQSKQSPERLLMFALEARALEGSSAGQIGLLAEAYRQTPNDARIAFWYAQSLVDAGFGNAANAVLQKHYAAIEQAFPGMISRLVEQIRDRIALENLPARMRARVEQLDNSTGITSLRSDRLPMFVRFRLTDSTGQPVEKSAIRVNCNGSDEQLTAYENGHFLFTFSGYRNNDDPNCKLVVSSPGLESREFELQPAAEHVANAGELVVKRFGDEDKLPLTILVADQAGKSVAKATVTLRPQNRGDDSAVQTTTTDSDGRAMFKAFPMNYTYTVAAKGFKNESGGFELKRDSAEQEPQRVKLYPAISATIRLAWSSTSLEDDSATTSNETTIQLGEGNPPLPHNPDTMNMLRPVQVNDKLLLQGGAPYFGGPMMPGMKSWVRRLPQGANGMSFEDIDLKKLDDLKDQSEQISMNTGPSRGPYPPFSFEVKQGEIYIGQIPGRDVRNGRPTLVSFKAFVEKLSTADASD